MNIQNFVNKTLNFKCLTIPMAFQCAYNSVYRRLIFVPNLKICLRFSSSTHAKKCPIKKNFVKQSSACKPSVPFIDGTVFSIEALNHHWGAWAIVIISALGVLGQFLCISRNAVTRDDVWLTKKSIAPCDVIETRKDYPAPNRKYKLVKPKKVPEGLLKAIQGDNDGHA